MATNEAVLADLNEMTYQEVADRHGWSRGRVYALALERGARKNEARIRERKEERERRRRETLLELLDKTATSDVLDFLDSLPDCCAAAIVTSPPYNVGRPYAGGRDADAVRHTYFTGWLLQIVSECARVLRPGGTLFLQVGSTRDDAGQLVPMDTMLYDPLRRTGLDFQSRVIWTIPHGLTPRRRLSERHETALVFSKGEPTFNPTPARAPQKDPGKRAFKDRPEGRGGKPRGALSGHPLGAWPSNVWNDVSTVRHNHPEKTDHCAQFPLALARRAIQVYTMPGDLVIDPFSGSGTTHEACIQTGRSFTGADLSYADTRRERLAKAMPDLISRLPGVTDASLAVWQAEARRVDHGPAAAQARML